MPNWLSLGWHILLPSLTILLVSWAWAASQQRPAWAWRGRGSPWRAQLTCVHAGKGVLHRVFFHWRKKNRGKKNMCLGVFPASFFSMNDLHKFYLFYFSLFLWIQALDYLRFPPQSILLAPRYDLEKEREKFWGPVVDQKARWLQLFCFLLEWQTVTDVTEAC